jgi:hypothetical protein
MLLRQSLIVGSISAPEDLARNDDALSLPAQAFDRVPHDRLGIAVSVGFGIIEEVHSGVVGGGHAFDGDLFADLAAVSDPCT